LLKKIIVIAITSVVVIFVSIYLLNLKNDSTEAPVSVEDLLLQKSDKVFLNLNELNWSNLSKEIHPKKGLTFSFYADLGSPHSNEITFTKNEVENLSSDDEVYTWGYDFSDKPFDFTVNEYVKNGLFRNHAGKKGNYSKVTYHASSVDSGGIVNTIPEYYPNAKYVEYYSPSEDVNWQALRFVYEKVEKEWYLFAIVRDVYSP
jgi:hypothetical protein